MINFKKSISEVWDHNLLETEKETSIVIFCDMDGVLADFDDGFKKISGGKLPNEIDQTMGKNGVCDIIKSQPDGGIEFWSTLPKLPDADMLWKFINSLGLTVKILSSTSSRISKSNAADIGKRKWLMTHLNPSIDDSKIILVDSAEVKKEYATGPNDILIDDHLKNIQQWRSDGGTGILHKSAADSIEQLKNVLSITKESFGYSWSNR